MKRYFLILTILGGFLASCASTQPVDGPGPFDKTMDAQAEVRRSLSSARASGKNVLLVYGANWCSDSIRMVNLLNSDPRIVEVLHDSYVVTRIDVGPKGSGRNADLVQRYHATIEKGIPVLVALDGNGRLLNDTRRARLRDSDHKYPERVLGFLRQHAPR